METTESKVSAFVDLFANIPEERQEWKIKHKLVDILFIAIVATIADCDDWEEIEWFANMKEGWFRKYIELPNGIPSHDTMERVFSWIDPAKFRAAFMAWAALAMDIKAPGVVAIDGKVMRGSKDGDRKPLCVVNAWFSENKMVLGQVFASEKSNEITAIPELIDILDVAGQIVTIDAAGTHTGNAAKIVAGKGDYVLALKGNQGNLLEQVQTFFELELKANDNEFEILKMKKAEKGHGRIETRRYYMCDRVDWLEKEEEWAGLKSIGMVKSTVTKVTTDETSEETRYFISSLDGDIDRFAYAVRQHWGVENMHWSLDMTWGEDRRRSRKDNSAKNLAQLIRLSLDIIKSGGVPKRMPLKRLRKQALVDDKYLDKLISGVFS
jgi:predicted transposase YbfD/YdcC